MFIRRPSMLLLLAMLVVTLVVVICCFWGAGGRGAQGGGSRAKSLGEYPSSRHVKILCRVIQEENMKVVALHAGSVSEEHC